MGQRSDAKAKMVTAGRQLIREHGYHATALSDVLELSGAPRGSVYFHFPGGKAQLAAEALKEYARDQADMIEHAGEESGSVVELISAYVNLARGNLVKSDYTRGCTIAPLVLEGMAESDLLAGAATAAFSLMMESLAFQFAFFGMSRASARELAELVVSGVEGALVTARAFRSPAPFDSMLAALASRAAELAGAKPVLAEPGGVEFAGAEPQSNPGGPEGLDQVSEPETSV
jgi:TetR/AcrR family transcriptional regulator, lmrAB and yxaGH operons repressor